MARRPDIVNTAALNGNPVTHSIQHYIMNNSVASSHAMGAAIVDEFSPEAVGTEISCMENPAVLQLSGMNEWSMCVEVPRGIG